MSEAIFFMITINQLYVQVLIMWYFKTSSLYLDLCFLQQSIPVNFFSKMLYNKPCIMLKKDSEPRKNSNETKILYNILTVAYFSLLNVISESLVLISLYSISEYNDLKFLFWINIPYISTLCNFEKTFTLEILKYGQILNITYKIYSVSERNDFTRLILMR